MREPAGSYAARNRAKHRDLALDCGRAASHHHGEAMTAYQSNRRASIRFRVKMRRLLTMHVLGATLSVRRVLL